jgi:hypothetical protein
MCCLCRTVYFLRAWTQAGCVLDQSKVASGATVLVSWCGLGLFNENRAEEENKEG